MKADIYKIENSVEKVLNYKNTLFLDGNEFLLVKSKLKGVFYKVYYPYVDSEKVIIYRDALPDVTLFKIHSYSLLRHQDILGSILSLNVSPSYLGDIIVDSLNYYFYIMSDLKNFIKDNLISIGSSKIVLEEISIDYMKDYKRKYLENEIIVSSFRIDNILSKIIGTNRNNVLEIIKNKEVILNYNILNKSSYILKENDIFSIRRVGKFKFVGVVNHTKKDNLIVKYLKYL